MGRHLCERSGNGFTRVARRDIGPISLTILFATVLICCDGPGAVQTARAQSSSDEPAGAERTTDSSEQPDGMSVEVFRDRYPWSMPAAEWPGAVQLASYVDPPPGYERLEGESGTWASFLRKLPIRLDRTAVRAHDGRSVGSPSAGVVLLPVGDENLQQCADTILRLRAEFLWKSGARDRIAFHFTSGDRSSWSAWRRGERFTVDGAAVERRQTGRVSRSRSNFRSYLRHLFRYAGTRSLSMDSSPVGADQGLRPGDFFVEPESPGHAVLLADVAENDEGTRVGVVVQGFMPAQELHVVRSSRALGERAVWFELPSEPSGRLDTPSWSAFDRRDARRFPSASASGSPGRRSE